MENRSNIVQAPHAVLVVLGQYLDGVPRENTIYCYSDKEMVETIDNYRRWGQEAYELY